jgi:hypothetical protein
MAEQSFSWLPEDHEGKINERDENQILQVDKTWQEKIKEKVFSQKTSLLLVPVLIIALLILKSFSQEEKTGTSKQLEIMTSTLPLSKGSPLEASFLRPALFNEYSLSKNQKIEALTFDAAEKIMGKVRAKKDIPPHKPIFWSDLELVPETKKSTGILKPKIIFSQEGP